MALHSVMLVAMRDYFLAQSAVKLRIKDRFHHVWPKDRLLSQENPSTNPFPQTMEFATYRVNGASVGRVNNRDSLQRAANVEIAVYSRLPDDAESLFETFYGSIASNHYTGTWTATRIQFAAWDHDSYSEEYDDGIGMCRTSATLVVKYNYT